MSKPKGPSRRQLLAACNREEVERGKPPYRRDVFAFWRGRRDLQMLEVQRSLVRSVETAGRRQLAREERNNRVNAPARAVEAFAAAVLARRKWLEGVLAGAPIAASAMTPAQPFCEILPNGRPGEWWEHERMCGEAATHLYDGTFSVCREHADALRALDGDVRPRTGGPHQG